MPAFMQQCGFPVLPLVDLVDHPLSLVGLGGKCTSLLRFIILHVQVREIAGYDEDVVFLVVPDESEFGHRVPLVIGTCTIGRIINVIWESEIDHLSMPWATAWMVQLLSCWKNTAVFTMKSVGEAQSEGASGEPQEVDLYELVTVRESICHGPFQTKIIEGWVKPLLGDMAHVMIMPLKAGKASHGGLGHFLQDSTFPTHIRTSRMEEAEFHLWLGTCTIATSSLRRECWWCVLCLHHRCPLPSCHRRWKLLLVQKPNQNPCRSWQGRRSCLRN